MGPQDSDGHYALLFFTVYNRLSWGHRLHSRSSQHVMLSSQTLGDLFDIVPCTSNEIPEEILDDTGRLKGYRTIIGGSPEGSTGCAMFIDGMLYGDGQSEEDYSE